MSKIITALKLLIVVGVFASLLSACTVTAGMGDGGWVRGHWSHGYWVQGHPAGAPGWVPGHYNRFGGWVPGHWR